MSAQQFRKKPVEIEAIQYRADITPPGVNEAAELLDLVAAREAELAQEATE